VLAGVVAVGAGTAAWAQGIIIEGDAPLPAPDAEVLIDEDADIIEHPPAVYGWVDERPIDCGPFHYWDGADCVDLRGEPLLP
jgi:hypothetical protein